MDSLSSLIRSDQIYEHHYQSNIENIFLAEGNKAQLYAIDPEPDCQDRTASLAETLTVRTGGSHEKEESNTESEKICFHISDHAVDSTCHTFHTVLTYGNSSPERLESVEDFHQYVKTHSAGYLSWAVIGH
ncbi:hypothetical protein LTR13_002283 [Exophiala sideris]|nr:hypothetical protein LTR13_002283 [Exophiala sideris]